MYLDEYFQSPDNFEKLVELHLQSGYRLESNGVTNFIGGAGSKTVTLSLLKKNQILLPYYPSIL